MTTPLRVAITGAAGKIASALIGLVANGSVFGKDQPIILHLLDKPNVVGSLRGVEMELEDCSFPLLAGIVATNDLKEAFTDIDFAIMLGAMPRQPGMERRDLLVNNVKIFKYQGEAIDKYAKKTVKIIVVGNPNNTNCYILSKYAPSIPKENFSALTRLDHNRARSQIAMKAGVSNQNVRRVIIWGNHSSSQFPDVSNGLIKMENGEEKTVKEVINDDKWIKEDFVKIIQTRGAAVLAAKRLSSSLSAAKAISDHCRDWFMGTKDWVSMAVYSDGSYNCPKDVIFSFPVTIKDGKWSIVQGLEIDEYSRSKLEITGKELVDEKFEAMEACES